MTAAGASRARTAERRAQRCLAVASSSSRARAGQACTARRAWSASGRGTVRRGHDRVSPPVQLDEFRQQLGAHAVADAGDRVNPECDAHRKSHSRSSSRGSGSTGERPTPSQDPVRSCRRASGRERPEHAAYQLGRAVRMSARTAALDEREQRRYLVDGPPRGRRSRPARRGHRPGRAARIRTGRTVLRSLPPGSGPRGRSRRSGTPKPARRSRCPRLVRRPTAFRPAWVIGIGQATWTGSQAPKYPPTSRACSGSAGPPASMTSCPIGRAHLDLVDARPALPRHSLSRASSRERRAIRRRGTSGRRSGRSGPGEPGSRRCAPESGSRARRARAGAAERRSAYRGRRSGTGRSRTARWTRTGPGCRSPGPAPGPARRPAAPGSRTRGGPAGRARSRARTDRPRSRRPPRPRAPSRPAPGAGA